LDPPDPCVEQAAKVDNEIKLAARRHRFAKVADMKNSLEMNFSTEIVHDEKSYK
jgi:hypothetical protein